MEDRPRGALTAVRWALLVAALAAGTVWVAPWAVRALVTRGTQPTIAPEVAPEDGADTVDRFVASALDAVGATILVQREEDGVVRTVAELPRSADRDAVAKRLKQQASRAGVELYTATVDGLDLELRAYADQALRHQALLVPRVPADPVPPPALNRRLRVQLAIIVAGVGKSDAASVITRHVPLTIAVEPYQPFALSAARAAALAWHEVLVELPGVDPATSAAAPRGPHPDTLAALNAVPYASGVLVDANTLPALPEDPFSVVVHTGDARRGSAAQTLLLGAQRASRRTAWQTLARTRYLAGRDGVAAALFDVSDPGLGDVLDWAESSRSAGYRLVLASEAARWRDVRGGDSLAGADRPM